MNLQIDSAFLDHAYVDLINSLIRLESVWSEFCITDYLFPDKCHKNWPKLSISLLFIVDSKKNALSFSLKTLQVSRYSLYIAVFPRISRDCRLSFSPKPLILPNLSGKKTRKLFRSNSSGRASPSLFRGRS